MCRRIFTCSLLSIVLFCSCIDHNYDLAKKEISTDVKIEGNLVKVPVGSMKAVVLDSLVDVDSIDILAKDVNGVYCITMNDSVNALEETIDPIRISIDNVDERAKINFSKPEISTVHINAVNMSPATFKTPTISLDDLNDQLPVLVSSAKESVMDETVDAVFDLIESGAVDVSGFSRNVHLDHTVSLAEQSIGFKFSYELPFRVETIKSIKLATRTADGVSAVGTLIEVNIEHPKALTGVGKSIDFDIVFPEYFVLDKYAGAFQAEKYTLSPGKNAISVRNLVPDSENTLVCFYIKEIVDVDNMITDGVINVDDRISYNVDYSVNGDVLLNGNMKRDDFDFNISLEVALAFAEVQGKTKDIEVEFEPVDMEFNSSFDNLQYLDSICYVDFEDDKSIVDFETSLSSSIFDVFELKKGYALRVAFPEQLVLNEEISEYPGKGDGIVYDPVTHAFYIYDMSLLSSSLWKLSLDRFDLNTPVQDGKCEINVKARISVVNPAKEEITAFVLEGIELETMSSAFGELKGDKQAKFELFSTDLTVKDAVVHTEYITSSLDTDSEFSFCEEIPSEIGRIESIGFAKDIAMRLNLDVLGLDDLDTDLVLDLHIALPSFLKLRASDNIDPDVDVRVEDDSLFVYATCNPSKDNDITMELFCTGLDFVGGEFGEEGFVPVDSADGKSYIKYDGVARVNGDASIKGMEFHSQVLEKINEIFYDVEFIVDEIEVKEFHGIYRTEIDAIEENLDLDLGEELAFIRDGNNGVTLAEPQVELVIENTIGVPVNVDVELCGKDAYGEEIPTAKIVERFSINPALYDKETGLFAPSKTKLFMTSDTLRASKVGYENVEIPNLARILETIPHTIDVKLVPVIDTSVTHHIDITAPLKLDASYAVNVPLKFENLHFAYSDTITGLKGSLGEPLDIFSNVELKARMNVINTIPIGLEVALEPLDENGDPIEDLTVDAISLKAGLGGYIVDADNNVSDQEAQPVEFSIKSTSGDYSALDKLAFTIKAVSGSVSGSVGLKGDQGLKVSDIVLEVRGDIETDLRK